MIHDENLKKLTAANIAAIPITKELESIGIESIEIKNFDAFLHFVMAQKIPCVFTHSFELSLEAVTITQEDLSDFCEEAAQIYGDQKVVADILAANVQEYNRKAQRVDYSTPIVVTYIAMFQTQFFSCSVSPNVVFDEMFGRIMSDDFFRCDSTRSSRMFRKNSFLNSLLDEYAEELEKMKEKQADASDTLLEQVKILILSDEKFHRCTNQKMRAIYLTEFVAADKQGKFKDVMRHYVTVSDRDGSVAYTQKGTYFIESLYAEVKAAKTIGK